MHASKKFLTSALSGFFLGCALVACGGGSAQAATLTQNFVTADNRVLQTERILGFAKNSFNGTVDVTQESGTVQAFSDPTGVVYAKMKAFATGAIGAATYVQFAPGVERFINTRKSTEILCSGSDTVIGYPSSPALYVADGCALHATIKALSN